ncbi:MAG: DUF5371 family protein [Candidatus Methanoperedens sp.]|nr:DUF5371 family protein [Candidatus Methanoperedens sp.]
MKLINAIRMVQEREKIKRKEEKEMQRRRMPFGNQFVDMQNPKHTLAQGLFAQKNLVHVQSIFPKEDVLELKMRTKEAHIKEALLKAVYFYLENADDE